MSGPSTSLLAPFSWPTQIIRSIVDDYPYLAMDTEFPGVVARPVGNFKNSGEYLYQQLRCGDGTRVLLRPGM